MAHPIPRHNRSSPVYLLIFHRFKFLQISPFCFFLLCIAISNFSREKHPLGVSHQQFNAASTMRGIRPHPHVWVLFHAQSAGCRLAQASIHRRVNCGTVTWGIASDMAQLHKNSPVNIFPDQSFGHSKILVCL